MTTFDDCTVWCEPPKHAHATYGDSIKRETLPILVLKSGWGDIIVTGQSVAEPHDAPSGRVEGLGQWMLEFEEYHSLEIPKVTKVMYATDEPMSSSAYTVMKGNGT